MDELQAALEEQHDELGTILGDLADGDWHLPTRCPGWAIGDVVLHLAQTDDLATASIEGRFAEAMEAATRGLGPATSIDEGAGQMVAAEGWPSGPVVLDRWRQSADRVRAVLGGADPHARVQWVAGQLSARTLVTTRLAECWIHTGDVLDALGRPVTSSPRLRHIARLAWRTLPYAFARAGATLGGAVAFDLVGPAGEQWRFGEPDAATVVRGDALDLCQVAGQRAAATSTGLTASGPDAEAVLALVRTFA